VGSDLNAKLGDGYWTGWTAAHYAAHYGHAAALKFLHEAGADLSAINAEGCTPAYEAVREGGRSFFAGDCRGVGPGSGAAQRRRLVKELQRRCVAVMRGIVRRGPSRPIAVTSLAFKSEPASAGNFHTWPSHFAPLHDVELPNTARPHGPPERSNTRLLLREQPDLAVLREGRHVTILGSRYQRNGASSLEGPSHLDQVGFCLVHSGETAKNPLFALTTTLREALEVLAKTMAAAMQWGPTWRSRTHKVDGPPAHAAAGNGRVEALRVLIQAGVNLNAKMVDGETPADLAARESHDEALKLILEANMTDRFQLLSYMV
ncbi:Dapk1, partial [Symbiodinium necroappetens]